MTPPPDIGPPGPGPPGPGRGNAAEGFVPRSVADAENPMLDLRKRMHTGLEGIVVGYREPLDLMLIASLAGGHVLLEGPPGVAKTLMAGAIARVLGVSFKRVQFTPDTTPAEIVGSNIVRA